MRAWVVVFAGVCVNLCLGILYAWSIWKGNLVGSAEHPAGTAMSGLNEGWVYLTDAQATWAYAICGITFAIFMIPGGMLQDKLGPRLGATLGGLSLGSGCILAGLGRSYVTLIAGFGVLGGIGMGAWLRRSYSRGGEVVWSPSSRTGRRACGGWLRRGGNLHCASR
jgi:OFA family oxalate/formate antiporter-like MFS transporter